MAADRDPESLCTATLSDGSGRPCTRFKVTGFDVCQVHGAGTPQSRAVSARHAIAELAARQGIELPEVKPKDFHRVAAEMISWNVKQFAELGAELEALRLIHSAVDNAREYGDLLDRLDRWGRTISVLIKAAAALPQPPEELPKPPPAEVLAEVLHGIRERMNSPAASSRCPNCDQPWPVHGDVQPDTEEDDDGVPVAEVVVLPSSDAPQEAPDLH